MDFTDKLENFLRQQITWLHVQSMTDAQKIHLDKLVKDGKASTTQTDWHRYLHSLPPDPEPDPEKDYYEDSKGKKFVYKTKDYSGDENKAAAEIPFSIKLSDPEDFKELYKYFRDNFRAMDKNRDNLDGTFARPFLDKWFGDEKKDGKPFWKSHPNYVPEAIEIFKKIGESIDAAPNVQEKSERLNQLFMMGSTTYSKFTPKNRSTFITFLKNPDLADPDFFTDISNLFSGIYQQLQYDQTHNYFDRVVPQWFKDTNIINNDTNALWETVQTVNSGILDEEVSDQQVLDMKLFYPDLIFSLYDKEKRQQAFSQGGYPNIVSIINNVKSNNDYKEDVFNKIVPKEEDKRTNWQYVDKKWSDYKEGTWDKLGNRHRRHSYSSQAGKELVDAIYGNKIKPKDGLEKILAEKDKIKEKFYISNPKAIPQFNWIFDVLKDAKARMPKAFADALRDGQKMHHIVEYIIGRAAREDKLEHAKTFMEMLTVMQYGPFTSDVRDKLFGKDMKWTFFGDMPSLKGNTALTFMANATDRVIKFGARAAFEIMNYGWRKFQRRGLKFGTAGYKKFMNNMDKWYGDVMMDPNMTAEKINKQIEQETKEREKLINGDGTNLGINQLDAEINAIKATLPPTFNDYDTRKKQFDADESVIEDLNTKKKQVDQNRSIISTAILNLGLPNGLKPKAAKDSIKKLEAEIENLEENGAAPDIIEKKYDELERYSKYMTFREQLDDENSDFSKVESKLNSIATGKNYMDNKTFFARPEIQGLLQKESEKKEKEAKIAEYDAHIEIMKNRSRDLAKNPSKDTTVTIEKDGKEKDVESISKSRNIAAELAVYWDFQQSGMSDNINPFRHQKQINANFMKAQQNLNDRSQFDVLYANFNANYANVGYTQ